MTIASMSTSRAIENRSKNKRQGVGPRLQSPVLVCFDDHKTYIVICTNHVCCFSVFQGSNDFKSILP